MTTQTLELIFLIIGIIVLLLALGLFMTSEWYEQEHGLNVQHSDLSNSINELKNPISGLLSAFMNTGLSSQNNGFTTSYENLVSRTTTSGGGSATGGANSGANSGATGGANSGFRSMEAAIEKLFTGSSSASDDSSSDKDSYNKTNKRILLTSMIFVWIGFVSILIGISLYASRYSKTRF